MFATAPLKKTNAPVKEAINPAQLIHSIGLPQTFLQNHPHQASSLFYIDTKHDVYLSNNMNSFDDVCKATGERFLCRVTLHELQKYSDWSMVLTDKAFYKFDVDSPMHTPRKRKDLLDFHSVDADTSNPLLLTTRIYKASVKNNMKSSLIKFMGNLGSRIDAEAFVQIRSYICQSELQRDQLVWLMNRAIRNEWQALLESHIIPEPEFYQTHQFVIKTNRKGAHQERLIALSNTWMYNLQISHAPTLIHEVKWAIRIDCIASVCLEAGHVAKFFFHQDKLREMIQKYRDEDRLGVNSKVVNDYIFSFRDDITRGQFIGALSFIFGRLTGDASKLLIINDMVSTPPPPPTEAFGLQYDAKAADTLAAPASTPASVSASTLPPSSSSTGAGLASLPDISFADATTTEVEVKPALFDFDDNRPLMCEPLEKMVKNTTKAHVKTFALYPNLTIKWGDSDKKFKYSAKILSVLKAEEILSSLPPEKKPCFFALRTSEKPLFLLARSATDKATWLNIVQSLLEPTNDLVANNGSRRMATSLQSTVPLIKGPMTKYIKGGKDKHVKHFCVYNNGVIKWGNGDNNYKHAAQLLDIDQDIAALGDKIAHEDAVRFVRIKTSEKTLELLCMNQDSADRWMMIVNSILHPDQEQFYINPDEEEDDE